MEKKREGEGDNDCSDIRLIKEPGLYHRTVVVELTNVVPSTISVTRREFLLAAGAQRGERSSNNNIAPGNNKN